MIPIIVLVEMKILDYGHGHANDNVFANIDIRYQFSANRPSLDFCDEHMEI